MRTLLRGHVSTPVAAFVIAVMLMAIIATALVVDAFGKAAASLFAGVVLAVVLMRWGDG